MAPKKTIKRIHDPLPPLLFPAKNAAGKAWMTSLKKQGRIRALAPRLYTSVPKSQEALAIRSGWKDIVAHLFPDAVLSHRSALEFIPSEESELILTTTTNRKLKLPGLTLVFVRGPRAIDSDPVIAGVRTSSTARAFLENLSDSRGGLKRSLDQNVLEQRLEAILQAKGEAGLGQLRDEACGIAKQLKWKKEFTRLDGLIGAILGTKNSKLLKSKAAKARSLGQPFDMGRIELFDLLFAELLSSPLKDLKENVGSNDHLRNKAFFEAYFSNYIEGTVFEIEEAEEIVFEKKIPKGRPRDGHDILNTFNIVSNRNEMSMTPKSDEELVMILKRRHRELMTERPNAQPGEFKTKPNRAGDTHFVMPELVSGTLAEGYKRFCDLPKGLARAIFMMFLVSEVHPFVDGNGRLARIMMNAELCNQELISIIIPTVYRTDYLGALRALSRRSRPGVLIKALTLAQKFSHLDFSSYSKTLKYLETHNWFKESDEAAIVTSNRSS